CHDVVGRTVTLERSEKRRPLNLREVAQLLDKGLELLCLHTTPTRWQITSARIALHHVRTEPLHPRTFGCNDVEGTIRKIITIVNAAYRLPKEIRRCSPHIYMVSGMVPDPRIWSEY
ncbi:MAG: hypothetical protein WAK60_10485, partial [Sedimentisphaerales bacterium]